MIIRSRVMSALLLAALLPAVVAVGVAVSTAQRQVETVPAGENRPQSYILPGAAVFPEGIAYQPETGDFFVSSTTDGTIFRGNLREPVAVPFLLGGRDGRTTAVGLKVDRRGRLFIAGGNTGLVFVYDAASGELLARLDTGRAPAVFVNDVAVTRSGDAYFTDSVNPVLYRVAESAEGQFALESFVDFTGTVLAYQPGFNLNGIAATGDGRYLIVVQSNTGKLFRIDTETREVTEIDLGGERLTAGDGLVLRGRELQVVRNQQELIVTVRLTGRYTRGQVISSFTDESFRFPTTAALARGRLLVVNSQFDRRGSGQSPELPFTVSSVPAP